MRSRWLFIALLAASLLPLHAQIGGGSIIGFVMDPSGASVPGVKVTAHNQLTNDEQTASTNGAGYYEFPLLRPGRYRLQAEMQGFEREIGAEFELFTGARPRIDFTLRVGSVDESVNVSATAPIINTTSTELGVVMDRSRVDELPLNGRDFQELLSLEAGVENAPANDAGARGGVSFHGSSALGTNMLLDGVDMSFGEVNGSAGLRSAGGGSVLINTVSVEALQEFRATGSAFSAEYGRSGGGVVNIVTRSGTNQFHGTLFEFFRNDKLDANDFFSNSNRLGKPPLRWNQYGGNLGGPVRRNRLFFFFNYEGAQVKRVSKITGNTATPALLAITPPGVRQFYELFLPKTYTPTSNIYIGTHNRNDQQVNAENTYLSRGDAIMGKDRIGVRYSYNHQNYSAPTLSPSMPTFYPMRFHNALIQDTRAGSAMVNELRLGFNRVDLNRHILNSEQVLGWVNIPSLSTGQSSFIHFLSTTYTIADNFSLVRGAHSLKAGFEIREVRSVRGQGGPPTYTYNSVADLTNERPLNIQLLFGGGKGLRTRNLGFFLQDDWKFRRNLQVSAGIRYEYSPPLRGGFNISSSDPYGPFIHAQEPMFRADRNDFAPRLGLVWVPDAAQHWAVRVGGGITYLMPQAIYSYDMAFIDPALPFVTTFAAADVPSIYLPYGVIQDFTNKVEANPSLLPSSFRLSRSVADYNRRDTYVSVWNFAIQRAVTSDLSAQAAYVGQRTVKLISVRPLNLIDPVTKARPDPDLGQINFEENAANIAYHAMELSLNQRRRHGLSYDVYFTWAKSIGYYNPDDTLTFTGNSLQDPLNIAGSKGPVRGLPKLRYTSVFGYEIPGGNKMRNPVVRGILGGWTLRGINTWRSGQPINILAGSDVVGTGRSAGQRPDPVAGVDPYIQNGLVWLNPAAFTNTFVRAQKRYGFLGFNSEYGPASFSLNAALHKSFRIREAQRVTFRLETFNTLNHTVLSNPVLSVSDPNFGKIQTASSGRNVQLALKYTF